VRVKWGEGMGEGVLGEAGVQVSWGIQILACPLPSRLGITGSTGI